MESPNPADVDTRSRRHFCSLTVITGLFGMNFGVGTDIQTAADGSVYVVSISHNAVYRISRR